MAVNENSVNGITMDVSNSPDSCRRAIKYVPSTGPKTSTPVKSKLVLIITCDKMPVSSDESVTIDITNTSEKGIKNPWGDIDVNDIPIEIVSDLNDTSVDVESVVLNGVEKVLPVYFNPFGFNDRKLAAMKFNLVIDPIKTHHVKTTGHGNICPSPPKITMPSKPDGSCLFN